MKGKVGARAQTCNQNLTVTTQCHNEMEGKFSSFLESERKCEIRLQPLKSRIAHSNTESDIDQDVVYLSGSVIGTKDRSEAEKKM